MLTSASNESHVSEAKKKILRMFNINGDFARKKWEREREKNFFKLRRFSNVEKQNVNQTKTATSLKHRVTHYKLWRIFKNGWNVRRFKFGCCRAQTAEQTSPAHYIFWSFILIPNEQSRSHTCCHLRYNWTE